MNERDGLIALHQITGIHWHTIDRLLSLGWNPTEKISSSMLSALKAGGTKPQTIQRIKEKWTPSFVHHVSAELAQRAITPITIWDELYPPLLKEIAQPPWVLYVKGDATLLSELCLAVVGTRRPTPYGLKVTRQLTEQMVQAGWVAVSGMAEGIDGEAHRTALKAGGRTIAVLAPGVDVIYPRSHHALYQEIVQKGAVISESPPGTESLPYLFPQRNRIISGLSLGTVVVEAAEKSGSLITADCSMDQHRDVFAVPGPITSMQSRGTLRLIQQGAKCVIEGRDIFEEFAHLVPLVEPGQATLPLIELTPHEQKLLDLIGIEPIQLALILEQVTNTIPIGDIHQSLLTLEIKQLIHQLPGGQYVRK